MSTGLERARERHTGTPAEQRDRGIAQAVRENDELRAENTKLLAAPDMAGTRQATRISSSGRRASC